MLLVIIIVPLIWGQIAAHTARSLLLDPEFTKSVMQRSGIYNELDDVFAEVVVADIKYPQGAPPFTPAEVSTLITRVLPPARLQVMAETTIDGLYRWILRAEARPNIVLDLQEVRTALPPALKELIKSKVEALPVCTTTQAVQVARGYTGGLPPCKLSEPKLNQAIIDMALPVAEFEKAIPARIDVTAEVERSQGPRFWSETHQKIAGVRKSIDLIPWGWAVILLLLGVLGLLNLDHWYTPFVWIGVTLLTGGGILLLSSLFVLSWVFTRFIAQAVQTGKPTDALALSAIRMALDSVGVALRSLSMQVTLAGLVSLIAGVAGIVTKRPPSTPGAKAAS